MAFGITAAATVFRSAAALVRRGGPNPSPYSLALKLRRTFGDIPGGTMQAFMGVARQATAAVQAGLRLDRRPANALNIADHPIDRSIIGDAPRFRYQVLIEATVPGRGTVRYAAQVDSDVPITRSQVRAQAEEHYSLHGYIEGASSALSQRVLALATPDVTIISAGRGW